MRCGSSAWLEKIKPLALGACFLILLRDEKGVLSVHQQCGKRYLREVELCRSGLGSAIARSPPEDAAGNGSSIATCISGFAVGTAPNSVLFLFIYRRGAASTVLAEQL
jgi:hypothetical protein